MLAPLVCPHSVEVPEGGFGKTANGLEMRGPQLLFAGEAGQRRNDLVAFVEDEDPSERTSRIEDAHLHGRKMRIIQTRCAGRLSTAGPPRSKAP